MSALGHKQTFPPILPECLLPGVKPSLRNDSSEDPRRMSAFIQSGRSDHLKLMSLRGRVGPQAAARQVGGPPALLTCPANSRRTKHVAAVAPHLTIRKRSRAKEHSETTAV